MLDYLAALLGIGGCYLVGNGKTYGWLCYASASGINAYLGYKAGLMGMCLGAILYLLVELRGYYINHWGKKKRMKNDYKKQDFYDKAEQTRAHWSRCFYMQTIVDGYNYAFRPYRPGYVTGFDKDNELIATNNFYDWKKIPYLKKWVKDASRITFKDYGDEYIIEAHMPDKTHWVIGFVNYIPTNLPEENQFTGYDKKIEEE